ncbi:ribonuclease P protein component [Fodinicola acaciae]|uniref:ribonuclease P protein component n=1 Tax=Fodinicola acaciae TaxID=2681555 RepID=UPI0013D73523|nr:ribonuclease P protein component [Fodinicola acaciae]
MLPAAARLRSRDEFTRVVRAGRRTGRRTLVAHLTVGTGSGVRRAGFVVSKAVGSSVVRHRVQRQLRHLVRDRLELLPAGSDLVVRALPAAKDTSSAVLGADLDSALRSLLKRTVT